MEISVENLNVDIRAKRVKGGLTVKCSDCLENLSGRITTENIILN